ncbi:shikimate dehydrogenase [Tateyamaria armeniaca]|uniref:Shikimate dehydrogenase n=1 Tax=Tateyamaria armeniaca TaxID=2518930 RepID=A0ABW8UNP6_9RHOB
MTLRLGLIGDNIAASRAPALHILAGEQNGIAVTYDRLVPATLGATFEQVFRTCQSDGYRGLNITYPYKERAVSLVRIDDPLVRAMGAVNTVLFEADGPVGYNTDHSGFVAAYRAVRGEDDTGPVLMIGAGGVGRAVAFGLATLGTKELRLVDRDHDKAVALADALAPFGMHVTIFDDADVAAKGVAGLINCTPVGMVGYAGTPLSGTAMRGADWAFDAVYTPVNTKFFTDAAASGLTVISGWELFLFQGIHAWSLFSDLPVDAAYLRKNLSV